MYKPTILLVEFSKNKNTGQQKEQYPVGHHLNAWLASLGGEFKAHAATFKQYPPKDIGLKK